jgi:hypothetical protein
MTFLLQNVFIGSVLNRKKRYHYNIKWVEDIVDRVKWDPNDATLVVVKRLKVTKREAILVSIARTGSAPDPKSMQTNRIIKEKNILL